MNTTPCSLRGFKQQSYDRNHKHSANPIYFVARTHVCLLAFLKIFTAGKLMKVLPYNPAPRQNAEDPLQEVHPSFLHPGVGFAFVLTGEISKH